MDWRDEGLVISARRLGESAAVVEIFTAGHGRHAGVVRGGGSRKMAPVLQPGTLVAVEWGARLEDHLGHFRLDPIASPLGAVLSDRAALAALASLAGLISAALPERAPHPGLYAATRDLVEALGRRPGWRADYARWEIRLLAELGFGLDLGQCAVTGGTQDLAFVSPRTGRAVSRAGAGDWADRLLPLPRFLALDGQPEPDTAALAQALALSGHFLAAWLAPTLPRERLPEARARAAAALLRDG